MPYTTTPTDSTTSATKQHVLISLLQKQSKGEVQTPIQIKASTQCLLHVMTQHSRRAAHAACQHRTIQSSHSPTVTSGVLQHSLHRKR